MDEKVVEPEMTMEQLKQKYTSACALIGEKLYQKAALDEGVQSLLIELSGYHKKAKELEKK